MADLSRIEPLMVAIKEMNAALIKWQIPLSVEEKQALMEEHGKGWNIIKNMEVKKLCKNCAHCVLWENNWCCAARDMAKIPFEISNDIGGCKSQWSEKDFIPFD